MEKKDNYRLLIFGVVLFAIISLIAAFGQGGRDTLMQGPGPGGQAVFTESRSMGDFNGYQGGTFRGMPPGGGVQGAAGG
ncbi:MAG: hypothetical protein RDV48_16935 [Candidatus Eremiobacteraeota bacterium]|nr:hypothetical protein [Candidatus Eremiobacteraeota bacterium]